MIDDDGRVTNDFREINSIGRQLDIRVITLNHFN